MIEKKWLLLIRRNPVAYREKRLVGHGVNSNKKYEKVRGHEEKNCMSDIGAYDERNAGCQCKRIQRR